MTKESDFLERWAREKTSYEAWGRLVSTVIQQKLEPLIAPVPASYFLRVAVTPRVKDDLKLVEKAFYRNKGYNDPYADISFDTAMTRFTAAIANQGGMRQFQVLTAQQVRDIAAYLADTPKTTPPSETQLNFSAALNGNSAAQTVTLKHATTAAENLSVKGVTLEGSGAGQFLLGNPAVSCLAAPALAPAQSCAVNVTYVPTSSGAANAELVFRMS